MKGKGGLTKKNRQAIEVYLGAGSEEAKGNGGKAWQEVYGTKSLNTAETNWARMFRNVQSAQEYLDRRRQEIGSEVTKRVVYDTEQAVKDLLRFQKKAEDNGDLNNAIKATVEATKVQGKYGAKGENSIYQATPGDRQLAGLYQMAIDECLERKAAGTLPERPEIPKIPRGDEQWPH